jgi:hypothetical protein
MVLTEIDWEDLLYAIQDKKCTAFLGPEIYAPFFPTDKYIAKKLAEEYRYPFDDSSQLSRVIQYLAIEGIENPKRRIKREILPRDPPDFTSEKYKNSPFDILARANLPIYITTNYDLFMEKALQDNGKEPITGYCIWNKGLEDSVKEGLKENFKEFDNSLTFDKEYKPTTSKPLVYHLNGTIDEESSMVLTEKDFFDYLIYLSREYDAVLPTYIRKNLAENIYLFIGYRLEDTNFLALFSSINFITPLKNKEDIKRIAVQFNSSISQDKRVEEYLDKYTDHLFNIKSYSGDPCQFSKDLSQRWEKFKSM